MSFERIVFDIETNGFMEDLINFDTRPLSLKDTARLWGISVRCKDTKQSYTFIPPDIIEDINKGIYDDPEWDEPFSRLKVLPLTKDMLKKVFTKAEEIIAHNSVKFDLPMLELFNIIEYEMGYPPIGSNDFKTQSTIFGKPVTFTDTLVWSQLLYADRPQGHSIKAFGKQGENEKQEFSNFSVFSKEMMVYMDQDTLVGLDAAIYLEKEKQTMIESVSHLGITEDTFEIPYLAEIKIADLALKQELHGFYYNSELSESNKIELAALLEERYNKVTPKLPPKPLNKGEKDDYTPPSRKVKKDGSLSSYMIKFLEKVEGDYDPINNTYTVKGKVFEIENEEPVIDSIPSSIKDLDVIKGYLLSLGWEPSEWKERDLTVDAKKKKRPPEKMLETFQRYAKQTFFLPYKKNRLEFLELPLETTEEELVSFLMDKYKKNPKKPLKVIGSPPLKVGAEKNICPNLQKLADEKPEGLEDEDFIKMIVEFYTYQHRLNSICGNVDEETGEAHSGFESFIRSNGTIPTVISTNSTSTSRMRHSVVN